MNASIIEGCVDSRASARAACRGGAARLELCANPAIGVLTPEGEVDEGRMRRLVDAAGGMEITLHRAFDMTRRPFAALESAVRLGCRTILTSGQARNALEGAKVLRELVLWVLVRIEIMAGCGVRKENIRAIHEHTGVRAFHTTGRSAPLDSGMICRKPGVSMGLPSLPEYELWRTGRQEFEECAKTFTPSMPPAECVFAYRVRGDMDV